MWTVNDNKVYHHSNSDDDAWGSSKLSRGGQGSVGRLTLRHFWRLRNQPKEEEDSELVLVRTIANHEIRVVEKICGRVFRLTQFTSRKIPIQLCFAKCGSHPDLVSLVRALVYETNFRLHDCALDEESIGLTTCLVAVEYVSRLAFHVPPHQLQTFFIAAFVLALKLLEDDHLPNSFFAKLGGFCLSDLNQMETGLCVCLNWTFSVTVAQYRYHKEMMLLS